MQDPTDFTPGETQLALLQACREELLAARVSIAACLEAIDRRLGEYRLSPGGEGLPLRLGDHDGIRLDGGLPALRACPPDLSLDRADRALRLGRQPVPLTDTEFAIILMLWTRQPRPVTRDEIVAQLGMNPAKPKSVDPFISHIRQKLRLASGGTEYIEPLRGRGWRLKRAEARQTAARPSWKATA